MMNYWKPYEAIRKKKSWSSLVVHSRGSPNTSVPQLLEWGISRGKKWRVLFFSFGEGGGRNLLVFSLVPIMYPYVFPWVSPSSQVVSQIVPKSTSLLSRYDLPKLQLSCIWTQKVGHREHICLYFAIRGPKRCFHWGVHNVPNFFWWWANQYDPFFFHKKSVRSPMK
jgi:hypothetical protein